MVEEVAKHIYRIGVPLPDNPLKELNSYFIRGRDRDLLIDTGFRCDACFRALSAGLEELQSDPMRRNVLITHFHSDHSGMADLFAGPGLHIYMSRADTDYKMLGTTYQRQRERHAAEGFPKDLLAYAFSANPAKNMMLPGITSAFRPLDDGDILEVGDYRLQTILVPGHTPGCCIFWLEEQGILFTGDHVLFDITPNITFWPGEEDPLGDYLIGLERIRRLPVRLALPGHRKGGDFRTRVDALLRHHAVRLNEAQEIVRRCPDLTAYEITGRMTWRIRSNTWEDFPAVQKIYAVGECLSHLDHLRLCGRIRRELTDGVYRYRTN